MNTIHVQVTQEDIDKGQARNCRLCPIALAANRALPDAFDVNVLLYGCYVYCVDGSGLVYELPEVARSFIRAYDRRSEYLPELFKPFEFDMVLDRPVFASEPS